MAPMEPVRETASMTAEYAQTDRFRGARIHLCDLAGLEIRDCEVNGLKIVDCYGTDVYLGGDFGQGFDSVACLMRSKNGLVRSGLGAGNEIGDAID